MNQLKSILLKYVQGGRKGGGAGWGRKGVKYLVYLSLRTLWIALNEMISQFILYEHVMLIFFQWI